MPSFSPGTSAPRRLPLALALVAIGWAASAGPASAQTVQDLAARGLCSTAGLEGISAQLAETQMCLRPGAFVRFAPRTNITLTSSRIHPFLQASARDAVWSVAATHSIQVNSAFRTLADQYVLYHSGGCGLAAAPGRSNHQTGRALDIQNYSAVRSAMQAAGCTWLGSSDPVHFDCPGTDRRSDAILAFQRLWNRNHPGDLLVEDGIYGPMTESRLGRSPAAGFATDGCGCEASCDGDTVVDASCGRSACGAGNTCTMDGGGPRCVATACPPTGSASICLDDSRIGTCAEGALSEGDCAAFGAYCSTAGAPGGAARCVSAFCVADPSEAPRAHTTCLPDGQLASCDESGAVAEASACPEGTRCVQSGGEAACTSDMPPVGTDAGSSADSGTGPGGDAGVAPADGGGSTGEPWRPGRGSLSGGCAASGGRGGESAPFLALLLLGLIGLARRRRR